MSLSLVTAPTLEPLTGDEAKLHLRIDGTSAEDALVDTLIKAARQHVETFTQRALLTQTWDWKLDAFPVCRFTLPMACVTSITSISYIDRDGASQTWSSAKYLTDLPTGPKSQFGRIDTAYGEIYPQTRCQMNAVTVRFVAGYGSAASSVPAAIKAAMKLLIGHWYQNRESVVIGVGIGAVDVPQAVDFLLWPYRCW
jgi:uncharacterized phiE125 gp8 family phage protein